MLWAKTAAYISYRKGVYVHTMFHCQQNAVFLRHFIHMVCQKCRAYNHKIMNFETMLPPFNAWIHLFQSKFAHDKALFDSTTVLISKSAGLKRMRKRDHTSSRNQIPFTHVCLVQKARVVNKSAQIMGCGVTRWEERPMLANQHQASGWIAMWKDQSLLVSLS